MDTLYDMDYAVTGFEDAALHWFVHKVKSATVPAIHVPEINFGARIKT